MMLCPYSATLMPFYLLTTMKSLLIMSFPVSHCCGSIMGDQESWHRYWWQHKQQQTIEHVWQTDPETSAGCVWETKLLYAKSEQGWRRNTLFCGNPQHNYWIRTNAKMQKTFLVSKKFFCFFLIPVILEEKCSSMSWQSKKMVQRKLDLRNKIIIWKIQCRTWLCILVLKTTVLQ